MNEKSQLKIGEALVKKNLIAEKELQKALSLQEKGELIGQTLIRLDILNETDLVEALSEHFNIPSAKLNYSSLDEKTMEVIPESFARKYQVIPLKIEGTVLTLATSDPLNIFVLDRISQITGYITEPVISSVSEIKKTLNDYYSPEKKESEKGIMKLGGMENVGAGVSIIKLVDTIIGNAVKDRASDIHIEPTGKKNLRVRYRIDGILHEVLSVPEKIISEVVSRTKLMAGMDISKTQIFQDGHFSRGDGIDIRASSLPSALGEKLVLRILNRKTAILGLNQLGLSEENLVRFNSLVESPYGIILVTGPTGSGKTTTLYSALSTLNSKECNVVTVEDPIEYQFELINQVQINTRMEITFDKALRSILRQDPDIIMVGEIRDNPTAVIAIQAALTGHLVFSTLHTNDAPSAVVRLIDLGIEPYLLTSSLKGVVAQRLVRTICSHCKEEEESSPASLRKSLGLEDIPLYKGKGCNFCRGTGYRGRTGIFEIMIFNDFIKELVVSRASATALRESSVDAGMKTLREDGIEKIKHGITTIDEVLRVTQDVEEVKKNER